MRVRLRAPIVLWAVCWTVLLFPHGARAGAESPLPRPESTDPGEYANQPALRVNTETISVREIERLFLDALETLVSKREKGELKSADWPGAVKQAWNEALQTSIQDALLDQMGRQLRRQIIASVVNRAHPGVPTDRIVDRFERLEDDELRRLKREMIAEAGGEEELRAALKRKGRSFDEWERDLRVELFRRYVLYESVGPIPFSPRTAREYYDAHPDKFSIPDGWNLRRIRVPKDKFSNRDGALQAVRMVHEKLNEGFDFGQLALKLGYDPVHDPFGGTLLVDGKSGWPSGNFPAEEGIARKLKDGEFSEPEELAEAFVIVKRESYRPAEKQPFEEAAERAAVLSFADKVKEKKQAFFEKQKRESYIEILAKDPPKRWLP